VGEAAWIQKHFQIKASTPMKNFKEENLASKFISVETLLFSGIFR
jgi:hypothetical protein